MSSPVSFRDNPGRPKPGLPLLESGDRLNSDEFLRRYERMPDVKKAELIEGVVYITSQLPLAQDSNGHSGEPGGPWLENGDTLEAEEFLRRYERMPDVKKAELVEGTVFMASPVSAYHGDPHFDLIIWLGHYRSATPKVRVDTIVYTASQMCAAPATTVAPGIAVACRIVRFSATGRLPSVAAHGHRSTIRPRPSPSAGRCS